MLNLVVMRFATGKIFFFNSFRHIRVNPVNEKCVHHLLNCSGGFFLIKFIYSKR